MSRVIRGAVVAVFFMCVMSVQAATAVWTGAANNKWDTSSLNWTRGGTPSQAYVQGDDVVFDDSPSAVTNIINIAAVVSPGSVLITNTTSKTYMFTNSIISGTCGLVKGGNGTVYFGTPLNATQWYTNSLLFTGGTVLSNGTLFFVVGTNAASAYATGGSAIGFGTGTIRLDGGVFGFSIGYGLSGAVVLTNKVVVGPAGGSVNLSRGSSTGNPQDNFSGDMDLYGGFAITNSGNLGNGTSNAVWRVMAPGITKLYNSATVTVEGATTANNMKGSWERNITQDESARQLTLAGGTEMGWVEFSGTNTGVTGGLVVQPNGSAYSGALLFTSTNAMGGGSFTIRSNAYAGLAFDFTADVVNGITYEDNAVLGIDSNSAVNIDLSATGINKDIWLGSARGATYTGTLTPFGSTYKLAGAGSAFYNPLILANTNALTGDRMLLVGGATNSMQVPGAVVLAAPNNYTGGTEINGTKRDKTGSKGDSRLYVRSEGALGTGPVITMKQLVSGGPGLYFETPLPVILTNTIICTGSVSAATICSTNKLTFRGDLTFYGTNNALNIAEASSGQPIVIFDQAASGKTVTFARGGRINQTQGLFDPVSEANFPTNIGYRQDAGATLLLSPTFAWTNFAEGRTYVNSSSPGAAQFQAVGFAARGGTQVIDDAGSLGQWATANPWVGGPRLGCDIKDTDGSYYANASVKVTRNITISNNVFAVTVFSTGPGITTNSSSVGVVHEWVGNLTGIGCMILNYKTTPAVGLAPELVMSGSNAWTGNYNYDLSGTQRIMTGPGGLNIGSAGTSCGGFVRFDGNESFPTGNGGRTAYLMALVRSGNKGAAGFMLTGGTTNRTYSLPAGYSFLLGGVDAVYSALGAALGKTTLTGTTVNVFLGNAWGTSNSTNMYVVVGVRDTNSTLTLGSAEGPVRFCNVYAAGTGIPNGWYSNASNATVMVDRPNSFTRIDKYGTGMLVLSNVQYTLVDGTTDNSSKFTWQLGSEGKARVLEGVVKETGTGLSNSLRGFKFTMKGAIYGLTSDWTPTVSTNAGNLNCESSDRCCWGFSAYSGDRVVDPRPVSGSLLRYGQNASSPSFFLYDGAMLTLNADDAEGELTFGASDIAIDLSGKNREILVWSTSYAARIPCLIQNTSGTAGLIKNGSGRLILSAATNTYNGSTAISNGTLTVNGLLNASAYGITVCSGGALEGTGTVSRAVAVESGGTLSAGAGAGLAGTLTVRSNLVLSAGSTMNVDLTPAGNDQVIVNGSGSIDLSTLSLTVSLASGYTVPGGNMTILSAPNATLSGTLASVPKGYKVTTSEDGHTLYLRRESAGFVFRIQ